MFFLASRLTSIPENLFANCPSVVSFKSTFEGCSGLISIPENLFANCPSVVSFDSTFSRCRGLTSIPEKLFNNCQNVYSFYGTFYYCTSLSGKAIPLWERVEGSDYGGIPNGYICYEGCNGLENFELIPEIWKKSPE